MPSTVKIIDGKKKCTRCGEWLDLDRFYRNGTYRNGEQRYHAACKDCKNAAEKKHRKKRTNGNNSPCYTCEHLEYCKQNLWTLNPLPCFPHDVHVEYATCEGCGTMFEKKTKNQRYCAPKCNLAHWKKKRREGVKE